MTFGCQRTDFTRQGGARQHREKTRPDKRGRFESTGGKLRGARCDRLVKACHALVWLSADAANWKIAERRQPPQQNNGTVLDLAIGLGQRGEGDVAFVHERRSATVYSGSLVP